MKRLLHDRHYTTLTGAERTAVALAALARGDDAELARLKATCPRLLYKMTDPDYSDRVQTLLTLTLATECDLRGWALVAATCAQGDRDPAPVLRRMHEIVGGLERFAAEHGIDPAHLRAAGAPRHELVELWLDHLAPEPDEAAIEAETEALRQCWQVLVEGRSA